MARAPELTDQVRGDLHRLARSGTFNIVGAVANAAFGFLLVVVVTRGLPAATAGVFFEVIALFTILSTFAQLGADTGLVRSVAGFRSTGRVAEIRPLLAVGLVPVLAVGALLAAAVWLWAADLARVFVGAGRSVQAIPFLRAFAPFLPLSAASTVCLAAARGFGTMRPFVAVDNFGKPAIRPILAWVVIAAGLGGLALSLAWSAPIAVGFAVALAWLLALTRRAERADPVRAGRAPATDLRRLASSFWRFATPRGLAAAFSIVVPWMGTLIVGALRSPGQAAIFTAATRYPLVGMLFLQSVILAIQPQLSALLASGDRARAQVLYQASTWWVMIASWPAYIVLVLFAPVAMRAFRPEYATGASALALLSLAQLANMAAGPVTNVLLMGGKSSWNFANTLAAILADVVLGLALTPRLGIEGAAIAWAAAIGIDNVAAVLEVRFLMRMQPFGRPWPLIALASATCFGGLGVAVRATLGASVPGLAAVVVLGGAAYVLLLARVRAALHLDVLGRLLSPLLPGRARLQRRS